MIVKEKKKRLETGKKVGVVWLVMVIAFLLTLNIQGVMAKNSQTNDTYQTGVAKVLNHLSLGIIDIKGKNNGEVVEKPVENKPSKRLFESLGFKRYKIINLFHEDIDLSEEVGLYICRNLVK